MKNGDIYAINDYLNVIAKEIEKVENKEPDYQKNKKWKLLRAKQDYLFYLKKQIEKNNTEEKTNA